MLIFYNQSDYFCQVDDKIGGKSHRVTLKEVFEVYLE